MDFIHLHDMEFYGYHGVLPEETKIGQRFRVNLSLAVDLAGAGRTDDLELTVNYAEAYTLVRDIVEGQPVKLIETVAERIAKAVLGGFAGKVSGCRVRVLKPDPPIPGHYRAVEVDITRGRF
ncbi:dihydroneopterin aldolase [Edaphobacillus lindanitolerans]|uniref:7,8-dihydroneopterin aldolase n=1 Tax=Edaphobacillus lindanitolerans TaxID=550447 RepID=A0A1U7PNU7_9BACI|nr:dihydroneopterin aldolase [Edaphobacillus lindanitolerans]SIT93319.1 dihydroneopterin aldolase [Edaphobacillus lindanitolerans]